MPVGSNPAHAWHGHFLAALPETGRQLVLSLARRQTFDSGERLVRHGDEATSVFILEAGRAAVRLVTPGGDSVTLTVLGLGDVFGEAGVFSSRGDRTATVQALEPVVAYAVRKDDIDLLRRTHPEVNDFFLELLARRIDRLSRLVLEAHHLPVEKRIARRLYEIGRLYVNESAGVVLPLTQDEIAQIAGTTRPTANQILKRLEADSVVELQRSRISLLNLGKLRALCAW